MAGLDYFAKSLVRVARKMGREVLEDIILGNFQLLQESGGRQMVSTSAGGKSFTFLVPSGMQIDQFMARVEEALEFFDSMAPDAIDLYLSRRSSRRSIVTFR